MLNITNYFDHPTRVGHTVFRFKKKERADYFQELLKKDNIWHECSEEDNAIFFFGVKKGDFKKAMNANYLVSAKFRKKIIPNNYVGWGIIILVLAIIMLAIIGAIVKT